VQLDIGIKQVPTTKEEDIAMGSPYRTRSADEVCSTLSRFSRVTASRIFQSLTIEAARPWFF